MLHPSFLFLFFLIILSMKQLHINLLFDHLVHINLLFTVPAVNSFFRGRGLNSINLYFIINFLGKIVSAFFLHIKVYYKMLQSDLIPALSIREILLFFFGKICKLIALGYDLAHLRLPLFLAKTLNLFSSNMLSLKLAISFRHEGQ